MQSSQTIFTALCSGATYHHSLDTEDISSEFVPSEKFIISVRTFIHEIKSVKLEERNSGCEVNYVTALLSSASESCRKGMLQSVHVGSLFCEALETYTLRQGSPLGLALPPQPGPQGRTSQEGPARMEVSSFLWSSTPRAATLNHAIGEHGWYVSCWKAFFFHLCIEKDIL